MTGRAITWTKEELDEFDQITEAESCGGQVARVSARLELWKFIERHGKEKCDAMFAVLQKRDEAMAKKKARRK